MVHILLQFAQKTAKNYLVKSNYNPQYEVVCFKTNQLFTVAKIISRPYNTKRTRLYSHCRVYCKQSFYMGTGLFLCIGNKQIISAPTLQIYQSLPTKNVPIIKIINFLKIKEVQHVRKQKNRHIRRP